MKLDINDGIGKKIRSLTAIGIDSEASAHTHRTHYLCRCDCGRSKSVPRKDFLAGKVPTCGNKVHQQQRADDKYMGKRAGVYEVIAHSVLEPHLYECRCTRCGFTRMVTRASLNAYLRGEICQCCENCRYDVGAVFGRLTIVAKDTDGHHRLPLCLRQYGELHVGGLQAKAATLLR